MAIEARHHPRLGIHHLPEHAEVALEHRLSVGERVDPTSGPYAVLTPIIVRTPTSPPSRRRPALSAASAASAAMIDDRRLPSRRGEGQDAGKPSSRQTTSSEAREARAGLHSDPDDRELLERARLGSPGAANRSQRRRWAICLPYQEGSFAGTTNVGNKDPGRLGRDQRVFVSNASLGRFRGRCDSNDDVDLAAATARPARNGAAARAQR